MCYIKWVGKAQKLGCAGSGPVCIAFSSTGYEKDTNIML